MTAPRHSGQNPPSRRSTVTGLVLVSLVAVACAAVGQSWSIYVGLALVIAALVWSTWSSWREIDRLTALHHEQVRGMRDHVRATSRAHHTELMGLVARFNARTEAHAAHLAALRAELAKEHANAQALRSDLGTAQDSLDASSARMVELQQQLSVVEAQLAVATTELENLSATADAQVVQIPRRGSRRDESVELGAGRRQA
ncbi:MAG TPA: hypothetical protein H9987_10615 [Candidatus Luteococcus avicola]|nr:hypothetical protein [Candidatus Luteococcus avicola]